MRERPESECRDWWSVADLLGDVPAAEVALLGAPLADGSLSAGRCDLAPGVVRRALARLSVYDVETGLDLGKLRVHDAGDLMLKATSPAATFAPIREAVAREAGRALTLVLGGNNAVTRGGVQGLADRGGRVGLLTLDAHFDLRDTDCGLTNGNPVSALLEDGFPGERIAQVGLAPFANTARMHRRARDAGISVRTLGEVRQRGLAAVVGKELERLAGGCDAIYVDFDIDVIDRGQMPAAPGARPGGVAAWEFFAAARLAGAHPKVRVVDLTEFDPSLDVGEVGALAGARWVAEMLAGLAERSPP